MTYIVTFVSYYGAMDFCKWCKAHHYDSELMSVPRQLSTSCGTCVRVQLPEPLVWGDIDDVELVACEGADHSLTTIFTY